MNETINIEDYVTAARLAANKRVCPATIYVNVKEGKLRARFHTVLGRRILLIHKNDASRWKPMKGGNRKGRDIVPNHILTQQRLAGIAGVHPATIHQHIKRGQLKASRKPAPPQTPHLRDIVVINRNSARAWLKRRGITEVTL